MIFLFWLLDLCELEPLVTSLQSSLSTQYAILVKELKKRDRLNLRQQRQNDIITAILHALSEKRSKYFLFVFGGGLRA